MNIINKPTATYEQCEAWLKGKTTASPLALQNLPILWEAAVKNNIDPVVLISQAMVETGFFKFGGVIDASFHNTCGLKSTKGGGNYEANAHMRFKSWEDGIEAHADHLALYAGSPNCPKYSPDCASHQNADCKANGTTKDPRHFTYLYGKCKTVESLKGNWATDPQYDTKLMKMIKEIQETKVDEPACNCDCHTPKVNVATANQQVKPKPAVQQSKTATTKPAVKQNKKAAIGSVKKAIRDAALGPFNFKKKK